MTSRQKLTFEARMRRDALFANDHCPTRVERAEAYSDIRAMLGCHWYTKHVHSNWCTAKVRALASKVVGPKLRERPNPTVGEMRQWAQESGIPLQDIQRAVAHHQVETVVEAQETINAGPDGFINLIVEIANAVQAEGVIDTGPDVNNIGTNFIDFNTEGNDCNFEGVNEIFDQFMDFEA